MNCLMRLKNVLSSCKNNFNLFCFDIFALSVIDLIDNDETDDIETDVVDECKLQKRHVFAHENFMPSADNTHWFVDKSVLQSLR